MAWVFLGLVPFVAVAFALVVPGVRRLRRTGPPAGTGRGLVVAAAGAALGVTAVSWAGQQPGALGAAVAAAALAALVPALRRLLPAGVFRGRRGVPTVVAARGLIAGVFFAGNSYLPLMLTATHGWSLTAAGVPLVAAALGWAGASAWQGRHPDLSRAALLASGSPPSPSGWRASWSSRRRGGGLLAVPAWTVRRCRYQRRRHRGVAHWPMLDWLGPPGPRRGPRATPPNRPTTARRPAGPPLRRRGR